MKYHTVAGSRLFRESAICLLSYCVAATASAAPINGEIAFSGSMTLDSAIPTAKAFTSFSAVSVSTGTQSGDYLGTALTPVSMNTFVFDPLVLPGSPYPLWSFSHDGKDYSFALTSLTLKEVTTTPGSPLRGLRVTGLGIASITGFDDTYGGFSITTTGNTTATQLGFGSFTFATGREVPVPDGGATFVLLGSSFLGFVILKKAVR